MNMDDMRVELEKVMKQQAEENIQLELQKRVQVLQGQFQDAVETRANEFSQSKQLNASQLITKNAIGGSIKRQVMNPDLQEERDKCNFD